MALHLWRGENVEQVDCVMDIISNPLYGGKPEIVKRKRKYHVIQGSFTVDCVREWYDTKEIAVKRWNERTWCLLHNVKDRFC